MIALAGLASVLSFGGVASAQDLALPEPIGAPSPLVEGVSGFNFFASVTYRL